MADLTILVPSRERPKNAVQLYESFRNTSTADTKLIIIVDADDPTLNVYYTLLNGIGQVLVAEPSRPGMVGALQSGFDCFKDHLGFAVGFMGDDHRPRTVGWDHQYLNSLRRLGSGFVYGNDLFQRQTIATQIAMTSDIPRALGYMCPPEFDHLCVDVVWNDWGNALGKIEYLDDVIIEHMHYLNGKGRQDKTYNIANSGAMAQHDSAAYAAYSKGPRMKSDVRKMRKLVKELESVDADGTS